MYERVKRLYMDGALTEAGLDRAVRLKWITEEQKEEIISGREGGSE